MRGSSPSRVACLCSRIRLAGLFRRARRNSGGSGRIDPWTRGQCGSCCDWAGKNEMEQLVRTLKWTLGVFIM